MAIIIGATMPPIKIAIIVLLSSIVIARYANTPKYASPKSVSSASIDFDLLIFMFFIYSFNFTIYKYRYPVNVCDMRHRYHHISIHIVGIRL